MTFFHVFDTSLVLEIHNLPEIDYRVSSMLKSTLLGASGIPLPSFLLRCGLFVGTGGGGLGGGGGILGENGDFGPFLGFVGMFNFNFCC